MTTISHLMLRGSILPTMSFPLSALNFTCIILTIGHCFFFLKITTVAEKHSNLSIYMCKRSCSAGGTEASKRLNGSCLTLKMGLDRFPHLAMQRVPKV